MCVHGFKDNIFMMTLFPKVTYRFDASQSNPNSFFAEMKKLILKFIWNSKGPQITKTILKKNKVERLTLPNFKTYYKATVIKAASIFA